MSCHEDGKDYIGKMDTLLCVKVNKHLDDLKKDNVLTPCGGYRVQYHEGPVLSMSLSILARESHFSPHWTLEALCITAINQKPTQINRMEARLETQDLAPLIVLEALDLFNMTARAHKPGGSLATFSSALVSSLPQKTIL